MNERDWFPAVRAYCSGLIDEFDLIPEVRKSELAIMSDYVRMNDHPRVIVICTHNSRRSHFGQIWLQVASSYYGKQLETFSGGTESTAFHPHAVQAIARSGFEVESTGDQNPLYKVRYAGHEKPITCFSKRFDHPDNPSERFSAIMVCSDAAEACPFVPGADKRFVLPYEDPREYDGTGQQDSKYDERCRQIGREMFYVNSLV